MRPFRADGDAYTAKFSPEEASILSELAEQIAELVRTGGPDDPAIARLFPDAYPDDAEASAEFRRFTAEDLGDRKVRNAGIILGTLGAVAEGTRPKRVSLSADEAQAWLRGLGDIRLSLASRLGITEEGMPQDAPPGLAELYDWLSFVQDSLVRAVDR